MSGRMALLVEQRRNTEDDNRAKTELLCSLCQLYKSSSGWLVHISLNLWSFTILKVRRLNYCATGWRCDAEIHFWKTWQKWGNREVFRGGFLGFSISHCTILRPLLNPQMTHSRTTRGNLQFHYVYFSLHDVGGESEFQINKSRTDAKSWQENIINQ